MEKDQASPVAISRLVLCVIALVIGTAVVTAEAYLVGYLDYVLSNLEYEWWPSLVRVLLVSAPFLLLAKRGVTAPTPWVVGLTLTVLIWGYAVSKQLSQDGTSVGDSMGVVIIALGSAAVITAICALLSDRYGRHASNAPDL